MNTHRKRVAFGAALSGAAVALVLSVTHNGIVTPAHSADSKATTTTVAPQVSSGLAGNGAGYVRGFEQRDNNSSAHPPHAM